MNFGKAIQVVFALVLVASNSCVEFAGSRNKDIYSEDVGERRRKASNEELLWTVFMGGCTAHLISPKYILTAAHCQPTAGLTYSSGAAIAKGNHRDIEITEVIELNVLLDYAILEFRWVNGIEEDQKITPSIAIKKEDVVHSEEANMGDEVYTIGFPTDKQFEATYAEGQLKKYAVGNTPGGNPMVLYYNIGIINGNSGGPVWRKSDQMLVTMTNGGPVPFGVQGWNNNNVNDPSAWNSGAALWDIYKNSAVMKDVFPNGKNRFVSQQDQNRDELIKDLQVALVQDSSGPSHIQLVISSSSSVDKVIVCPKLNVSSSCGASMPNAFSPSFQRNVLDKKIFVGSDSVDIKQSLEIAIVGFDINGKKISGAVIHVAQK